MKSKKDNLDVLGEYLRVRAPSPQEERLAIDHALTHLRAQKHQRQKETAVRTQRLVWTGLAAAVLLAASLSFLLIRRIPPAEFESIDGMVERIHGGTARAVQIGERVPFGEIVRSASKTSAVLALRDGSRIEMRSNSEVSLEKEDDGLRIRLGAGGVLVTAAKQRAGHLYVQTKDLGVSVVGTLFFVNAEEAGSRVAVLQGEVEVQQKNESKTLLPGEQVASNPLMESHPIAEQVAWSRSAEMRRALSQQRKPLEFEAASLRLVEAGTDRLVTRLRCKGTDGEFNPVGATAPAIPLGRCAGENVPLVNLIASAYDIDDRRVSGLSDSQDQATYQVEAKAEDPSTVTIRQLREMLQNLLADRLKLRVHRETREMDGYILRVAPGGRKFPEIDGDEEMPRWRPSGPPRLGESEQALPTVTRGKFRMKRFVESLSLTANVPIVDKTDLNGLYDISLSVDLILRNFVTAGAGVRGGGNPSAPQDFDPPLPKALEDQLGLRLEPGKVPVEYLVVDHIEKVSGN
jgi:uncharacterized protein (TIGR03435 family)